MMLPALLLLSSALAAAPQGGETEIRFAAEDGSRLLKTITWKHELNLDEMGSTRSGSDLMRENVGGWLSGSMTKVYVDEYLSVADGRPQLLRRLIRNMTGHGKVNISGARGRVEERTVFTSPMKGLSLLLTWVEQEGEYGRMYEELDGDELLLKELSGDIDLLGLLPSGPVAEGATWEVAASSMRDVLAPGGNLGAIPSDEGFFPRMMEVGIGGDLADVLGQRVTGTVLATYTGERIIDDRSLARIELAIDLKSKRDRTGAYRAGMQREERQESATLRHVSLDYTLVGTAELLWDLEGGHFDSFEVVGNEAFTAQVYKLRSEGAEPFESTQVVTFSGGFELDYTQRKLKPASEVEDDDAADDEADAPVQVGGGKNKRGKRGKK